MLLGPQQFFLLHSDLLSDSIISLNPFRFGSYIEMSQECVLLISS